MSLKNASLEELRISLPPIFSRPQVKKLFPGIISPHYLARLDIQGDGPGHFKMAGRVMYHRDSFIDWLAKR